MRNLMEAMLKMSSRVEMMPKMKNLAGWTDAEDEEPGEGDVEGGWWLRKKSKYQQLQEARITVTG